MPSSLETCASRTAARHRGRETRAAREDLWIGRLRVRRPLLRGLRNRGDHAGPGGRRDRRHRVLVSHHDGHRHSGRDRGRLLLADDSRLPIRRRLLHRRQGQPGDAARSRRGGGPAPRLHSHRGSEHRGRGGRRHLSLPGAVSMARRDLRRHRDGRNRRQPPGCARVGKPLHHSHLLVHRKPGRPPGGRRVPNRDRNGPAAIRPESSKRPEGIDALPAPTRLLVGVRHADRHRGGEQRHSRRFDRPSPGTRASRSSGWPPSWARPPSGSPTWPTSIMSPRERPRPSSPCWPERPWARASSTTTSRRPRPSFSSWP